MFDLEAVLEVEEGDDENEETDDPRRVVKRPPILMAGSVSEFISVSLGKAGSVPSRSPIVLQVCLDKFTWRMHRIVEQRHDLACSSAETGANFPITPTMRGFGQVHTQAQIEVIIANAITEELKHVLGGM